MALCWVPDATLETKPGPSKVTNPMDNIWLDNWKRPPNNSQHEKPKNHSPKCHWKNQHIYDWIFTHLTSSNQDMKQRERYEFFAAIAIAWVLCRRRRLGSRGELKVYLGSVQAEGFGLERSEFMGHGWAEGLLRGSLFFVFEFGLNGDI